MTGRSPTRRWQLVPDPDDPSRRLWEWNPTSADDINALFERVRNGNGSDQDRDLDSEFLCACAIDRFIMRVYADEPIEPWILRFFATQFWKVLSGGDWVDEFMLPGRPGNPVRSAREQRNLEIFCDVANQVIDGATVEDAFLYVAENRAVSVGTARAAYYSWKQRLPPDTVSKKS